MNIFRIVSSLDEILKDPRGLLNKEIIGIVYDDLGDNWLKVQARVGYEGGSHSHVFPGRGGLVGFRVYLFGNNLKFLWSKRPTDRQKMAVRDYLREEYGVEGIQEDNLFF